MHFCSNHMLYCGDCLEIMPELDAKSVDMVLCDLPYGTTACKWDVTINLEKLWINYWNILKDNGVVLLFGSEPFSSKLRMSCFNFYRYDWYWVKNHPSLYQHAKNRPMKAAETISIFSKAKWGHKSQVKNRINYYPQGVIPLKMKTVSKNCNAGKTVGLRSNQVGKEYLAYTNFPNDVLHFDCLAHTKRLHSSQKPVALLEYLIKTYTNAGDLVLDNCMGSGSTGVACMNTGRRFIGIEKEKEYYEIAKQRIEEAKYETTN